LEDNIGFFTGNNNIVGKYIQVTKGDASSNIPPQFQNAILDFSKLNSKSKDISTSTE
jgi:hypothetical protein